MPTPEMVPERRADAPSTPAGVGETIGAIVFVLVSLWLVATTPPAGDAAALARHAAPRPAVTGGAR